MHIEEYAEEFRMGIKEPSDATTRMRVKQSISVPFIWEQFPGIPKKGWKATPPPNKPAALPPKYIASVPFKWEEKPGTPLPSFPQPQENINSFPLSPRHRENSCSCLADQDGDEIDMLESYPETCESETDDSFTSAAPSLMVNALVRSVVISSAVPVQQISVTDFHSDQLKSPTSPASETYSSTSSYETGATSLAGASFLERLFPLLTPQSNFLEKAGRSERGDSHIQTRKHSSDFLCEKNNSASIKKPQTLGELILMSRRFSYQRKTVQMRTQNLPKNFKKRNGLACCILETSNVLRRFQKKWRRQIQLD